MLSQLVQFCSNGSIADEWGVVAEILHQCWQVKAAPAGRGHCWWQCRIRVGCCKSQGYSQKQPKVEAGIIVGSGYYVCECPPTASWAGLGLDCCAVSVSQISDNDSAHLAMPIHGWANASKTLKEKQLKEHKARNTDRLKKLFKASEIKRRRVVVAWLRQQMLLDMFCAQLIGWMIIYVSHNN